jgi:flagellar hook-length control protein FliK
MRRGRKSAADPGQLKPGLLKPEASSPGHAADKPKSRFSDALAIAKKERAGQKPEAGPRPDAEGEAAAAKARSRSVQKPEPEQSASKGGERLAAAKADEARSLAARKPGEKEAAQAEAVPAQNRRRSTRAGEDEADGSRLASLAGTGQQRHGIETKPRPKGEAEAKAEADIALDRKDSAKREAPSVTVVDLRRNAEAKRATQKGAKQDEQAKEAGPEAVKENVREDSSGRREIVRELYLEPAKTERNSDSVEVKSKAAPSSDFATQLAERLRDSWNGDIVQSAHLVLKDGDSGTIRLRLRPESLGSVKIELNLSEKNISGKIVVESDEAKTAFEKNLSQLADAFRREGFDSAKLEVSVDSGSGRESGSRNASDGAGKGPFFSERLRTPVAGGSEAVAAAAFYGRRGSALDLYA